MCACKDTLKLTHWGRVTHICVSNLIIIGSDNGLLPSRRQAIIWTGVGILLIEPLGTNFSEMFIEIHTFLLKKNPFENVVWKMAAILSWPQCVNTSTWSTNSWQWHHAMSQHLHSKFIRFQWNIHNWNHLISWHGQLIISYCAYVLSADSYIMASKICSEEEINMIWKQTMWLHDVVNL